MYFGESILLEKDKTMDYENPAGRKVVNLGKDWLTGKSQNIEIQAGDAIDVELKHTLETFNEKKHKLLLESSDIVKDYNEFVKLNFEKNISMRKNIRDADEDEIASYSKYFLYIQRDFLQFSGNINLKRSIKSEYHELDDPEMIKKVIQYRIKYIEGINAILREMINTNGELLGFNSNEIEELIKYLDSDETNNAIAQIKLKIVQNKDKFIKDNDRILDLRSLGHGVMICADDDNDHNFKTPINISLAIQPCIDYDLVINAHGNFEEKENNNFNKKELKNKLPGFVVILKRKFIHFLTKNSNFKSVMKDKFIEELKNQKNNQKNSKQILKFIENTLHNFSSDVILYLFDEFGPLDNFSKENNIKKLKQFIMLNKNNIFKNEYLDELINIIADYCKSKSDYFNKLRNNYWADLDKNSDESNSGKRWTISPIRYLDGKEYTDIKTLLKIAKQDGFERIKISACNPAGLDLPKDLKKNVTFSKYSIFKESNDIDIYDSDYLEEYSDINIMLDEMEFEYKSLAESYNIDYSDTQYLNECYNYFANQEYLHEENFEDDIYSLVEGKLSDAFDKILELIKKAIGFFVGLIRKFIELIKRLIEKVKAFIGKKKQNKVKESTVKASFITASKDSAKVTDPVEIESQKQLEDIYTKQIKEITQTMKQNTDEQVRLEKDLESKIKQLESKQDN